MSDKSDSSSGGIGLCGMLFLVFLVLKLIGVSEVANWSWWWVTSPLWIPVTLAILFAIIILVLDQ